MRESASFVRSPSSSLARLDRGGVHPYRWLVDGPFPLLSSAPAFSVSFSTSKMFGVLSASERERAFVGARPTPTHSLRDYIEGDWGRDGRPTAKKFRLLRANRGKNGSEAETQRLCRRVKARASPSLAHHASQSSFPSIQSECRGRGRRLGVASCPVGEPNSGRRLEFSGES